MAQLAAWAMGGELVGSGHRHAITLAATRIQAMMRN